MRWVSRTELPAWRWSAKLECLEPSIAPVLFHPVKGSALLFRAEVFLDDAVSLLAQRVGIFDDEYSAESLEFGPREGGDPVGAGEKCRGSRRRRRSSGNCFSEMRSAC